MWWTITLRDINDIPKGTLVRIVAFIPNRKCTIISEVTGERVIMYHPMFWCEDIGLCL